MAITCKIKLEHTGLDMEIPAYISVQNVILRRMVRCATKEKFWLASASVLAHVSREAKQNDKVPLESSQIECEFDPAKSDPLTALYDTLKQVPRFADAVDV